MTFESPYYLALLITIPMVLLLKKIKIIKNQSLIIGNSKLYLSATNKTVTLTDLPFYIFLLTLCLLTVVLAQPHYLTIQKLPKTEDTEIILAIDTSISMWFLDDEKHHMRPVGYKEINDRIMKVYIDSSQKLKQRIHIAKEVLTDFIKESTVKKIGLVVFKAQGLTLTPPTDQKHYLIRLINELNLNMIYQDGTAIGDALGTSINTLKYSQAKNKIIILITDGNDNQEHLTHNILTQAQAAELAASQNIKVYTIGIGGKGRVFTPYHFIDRFSDDYNDHTKSKYFIEYGREQINEESLKSISKATNGKFYYAQSKKELQTIYKDISRLENTDTQTYTDKKHNISFFLLMSTYICMFIGGVLQYTLLRVFP